MNGLVLSNQTPQNCWEHLRKNWKNLAHITNPTDEMYLYAIDQNWQAIKYVPKARQTEQMCIECIKQSAAAWKHIKIASTEVLTVAVSYHPNLIKHIADPNSRLQFAAVCADIRVVKHIKNPCAQVLRHVIEADGTYIGLISPEHQTLELCLLAAKDNPDVLKKCFTPLLKNALEIAVSLKPEYDKLVEENKQLWNEIMYRPGGVGADAALARLKNNAY